MKEEPTVGQVAEATPVLHSHQSHWTWNLIQGTPLHSYWIPTLPGLSACSLPLDGTLRCAVGSLSEGEDEEIGVDDVDEDAEESDCIHRLVQQV